MSASAPAHLTPPYIPKAKRPLCCPSCSPIRLFLKPGYFRRRMRHSVVKRSSVSSRDKRGKEEEKSIEISQDLDTSNWDFMPYFPGDPNLHSSLQKVVFPWGLRWKKMCSAVIGLEVFSFFLNTVCLKIMKIFIYFCPKSYFSLGSLSYFEKIKEEFHLRMCFILN